MGTGRSGLWKSNLCRLKDMKNPGACKLPSTPHPRSSSSQLQLSFFSSTVTLEKPSRVSSPLKNSKVPSFHNKGVCFRRAGVSAKEGDCEYCNKGYHCGDPKQSHSRTAQVISIHQLPEIKQQYNQLQSREQKT